MARVAVLILGEPGGDCCAAGTVTIWWAAATRACSVEGAHAAKACTGGHAPFRGGGGARENQTRCGLYCTLWYAIPVTVHPHQIWHKNTTLQTSEGGGGGRVLLRGGGGGSGTQKSKSLCAKNLPNQYFPL